MVYAKNKPHRHAIYMVNLNDQINNWFASEN